MIVEQQLMVIVLWLYDGNFPIMMMMMIQIIFFSLQFCHCRRIINRIFNQISFKCKATHVASLTMLTRERGGKRVNDDNFLPQQRYSSWTFGNNHINNNWWHFYRFLLMMLILARYIALRWEVIKTRINNVCVYVLMILYGADERRVCIINWLIIHYRLWV